jgi:DNA-binding MarR family transcriptional regulator
VGVDDAFVETCAGGSPRWRVAPGQFPALLALYEREGRTQAELCQLVRIEQPTMANTLNRMQRDGLIDRDPDPADGRRSLVELTQRGRALEPALVAAAEAVNASATAGISAEELATLLSLVTRVIDSLDQPSTLTP